MVSKHNNSARTAAEQKFWDGIYEATYTDCVKHFELKGVPYCSKLAREAADAALDQRRNSQRGVQ